MVSFVDVAPAPLHITVGAQRFPVYGIEITAITAIHQRFPHIAAQIGARMARDGKITEMEMLTIFGPAIGAIIAAGCGMGGKAEEEAACARLPIDTQLEFVGAILKKTMPDGVGPFVEKIVAAVSTFKTMQGTAPVAPAKGRIRVRPSREPSTS